MALDAPRLALAMLTIFCRDFNATCFCVYPAGLH